MTGSQAARCPLPACDSPPAGSTVPASRASLVTTLPLHTQPHHQPFPQPPGPHAPLATYPPHPSQVHAPPLTPARCTPPRPFTHPTHPPTPPYPRLSVGLPPEMRSLPATWELPAWRVLFCSVVPTVTVLALDVPALAVLLEAPATQPHHSTAGSRRGEGPLWGHRHRGHGRDGTTATEGWQGKWWVA